MSNKLIYLEFTPNTERNLKVLAKKYRHIREDIQPVIEQLESGDIIGDQIPGTEYTVFKVRVIVLSIILKQMNILLSLRFIPN